ncbi:hypothetical protein GLAREA_01309 [Glarea lozoyensis ATCC 20868]|uniref:Uncharacterized protein n=1 Tax=Glarea lozoyensis (strain ATCC 20868 / MF5171) TaxID=1116229 RepID=S3CFV8_GLAL2|nr:uncharacterized protein GLAREA_01309 [Glarea lozoyensis ATCC 20868]EPE25397.1 hypothetical protein GLAREA_01309 [Glarea lozoyensis ATCC 20868]
MSSPAGPCSVYFWPPPAGARRRISSDPRIGRPIALLAIAPLPANEAYHN